jgi:hypothetical protein
MPDGAIAAVPLSSVPFNAASNPFLINMTTINYSEDPRDMLPSELQDPWPPTDAEIEMMEWLQEQEELERTVPSVAERNQSLK